MIYFDTAYIAKCYLNEPHAEKVRAFARKARGICSSEWARVEFASVLHHHRREGRLRPKDIRHVLRNFKDDEMASVWTWFPVTSELLARAAERVVALPARVVIRAADALHLACASVNGLDEIYSNDRRLLECAPHFGLEPVDILAS